MPEGRSSPGSNVDQLRNDIDQGRTGEKRPRRDADAPDVAAAPLGTDEEAAGTRPDPGITAQVRRAEQTKGEPHEEDRISWLWHFLAIIAVAIAIGVGLYLLM